MRYAIIKNGAVINVTVAEADFARQQGWIRSDEATIGDIYDGEGFIKPDPVVQPDPAPEALTASDLAQVLIDKGVLVDADLMAAKKVLK